MSKLRRGDTLIEVIFAFAILGTIIGFSFTGVIAARRNAVAAQQRTQALEIAQYECEGLQTYRNSMQSWDGSDNTCPSFIGGVGACAGSGMPAITLGSGSYCVFTTGAAGVWQLTNVPSNCNSLVPYLHLDNGQAPIQIQFSSIGRFQASGVSTPPDNQTVQATIGVSWTDPFGQTQSVKNIVILTKQK